MPQNDTPLIRLYEGDSLDVLATAADGTYTAFVTDPPYGLSAPPDPLEVLVQWLLTGDFVRTGGRKKPPPPGLSELAARFAKTAGPAGFLGHAWDSFVPGPRLWREVFRVCKPGAIGLVFAATRTMDWMTLSMRLAGFEVLDVIGWIQSQGMAKSGTVDKRIDARNGDERERVGIKTYAGQGPEAYGSAGTSSRGFGVGDAGKEGSFLAKRSLTIPATSESAKWQGYSTQLGPGYEPIIVVRKPCDGTAVENVLTHGCGAMNIDACRIVPSTSDDYGRSAAGKDGRVHAGIWTHNERPKFEQHTSDIGRWPKNVMFDEASAALLDLQVGERKSGSRRQGVRSGMGYGGADGDGGPAIEASRGGPSRFFWVGPNATADDIALPVRYVPKASKADRASGLPEGVKADHPTCKPHALMRWLCRLVGHAEGRILDPFAGSGSTLRAARAEGLPCDGVERDHHYAVDLALPRSGASGLTPRRIEPDATNVERVRTADEVLAETIVDRCCLTVATDACVLTLAEADAIRTVLEIRASEHGLRARLEDDGDGIRVTADGSSHARVRVRREPLAHVGIANAGPLHTAGLEVVALTDGPAATFAEEVCDWPEVVALLLRPGDVLDARPCQDAGDVRQPDQEPETP